MNTAGNIVHLNVPNGGFDREKVQSLLAGMAQQGHKQLLPLLQSLLDQADTHLFELANKSENGTQQAHYFDTMRDLRRIREQIEQGFRRAMEDGFGKALHRRDAEPGDLAALALDADSLTLVDEQMLEESLAIKGMIDKVSAREQKQLDALEKRLDYLLAPHVGKQTDNPLSPAAICDYFQTAIKVLDADISVRLVIFKLFDLHLASQLGELYELVNTQLVQAGVLPQLPGRPQPPESSASARKSTNAMPSGIDQPVDEPSNTSDGKLLSMLQELLRAPAAGSVVPMVPVASIPAGHTVAPVSVGQLMQTLTQLQQGDGTGAVEAEQFRQMIAQHLPGQGEGMVAGLQQREGMLIDVVAMLFSVILDDRDIPDAAKALIGRMQIPLVKVALLDESFLAKKTHPARQLLNRLAQVCSELDQYVDSETPMLLEIRRIVDSITSDFESDMGVFERELDALEMFMTLQNDEQQQLVSVIHTAKSQQESQERIRLQVEETIHLKLAMTAEGIRVPEVIRGIITGPWQQALLHTARQHGLDSPLWEQRSEWINQLIDSIQPREDGAARSRLLKAIPALVVGMRQGLQEAGIEQEAINQVIKMIEPLHMAILTQGKLSETDVKSGKQSKLDRAIAAMEDDMAAIDALLDSFSDNIDELALPESAIPDEFIEDIILASEQETNLENLDDEYIQAVRAMEAGQMVILHDKDDRPVRCKLTWKSDYLGEYVFTNWRHKVVAERTVYGLAADLYRGKLELLEQTPLLERAIEKVFSALRIGKGEGLVTAEVLEG